MYKQLETEQLLRIKQQQQESMEHSIKFFFKGIARTEARTIKKINKELKRRGE